MQVLKKCFKNMFTYKMLKRNQNCVCLLLFDVQGFLISKTYVICYSFK